MTYNNRLDIAGEISDIQSEYVYEDKNTGRKENFYRISLRAPRLSENYDEVPIIVPEKLLIHNNLGIGAKIRANGSIRTKNINENGRHVSVFAFANDVIKLSEEEYDALGSHNIVSLDGTICNDTKMRQTHSGRKVSDLIIAFNRELVGTKEKKNSKLRVKSYYVPCIAWGALAKAAEKLKKGDQISLSGRFQSRAYRKKDDLLNDYVAYEVSIQDYSVLKEGGTAQQR